VAKFSIKQINREDPKDYAKWTNLLFKANGITIFHHPDFLSYHNDKFNEHHLGVFKGEELFGIMPLAIFNDNGIKIVKSPYGASYGGFIFQSILSYSESKEIIAIFLDYLKVLNVDQVIIVPSLPIYHNNGYSDTFSFSLLENGFKINNSDITDIVTLDNKLETRFNSRVKRNYKKSNKYNLEIKYNAPIDDFWMLMDKTFTRHDSNPTHKKEEFIILMNIMKDKIYPSVVYFEDRPIAAIGEFILNHNIAMSFYICGDDEYRYMEAQTYLIVNILNKHFTNGVKFYDFGTCSLNMVGNPGIFSFKEGFGANGIFRNTYGLDIK
jgi:lipid II:glycine glycyltransferase (peptidoglycan interpeptide bridge formation enzyme)